MRSLKSGPFTGNNPCGITNWIATRTPHRGTSEKTMTLLRNELKNSVSKETGNT